MKICLKIFAAPVFMILCASAAFAEIKKEAVEYKDGKNILEGFLVYDDTWVKPRPTVVIVHQWMGISDHEKNSAERLAHQGYVAFVLDLYGKNARPANVADAGEKATKLKSNIKEFQQRERAAFDFLIKNKRVDAKKIVVMGYCLGGTGALEAARAGLPVMGAVSFHGGLSTPEPQNTKVIKPKLLIMHGALDPYVPVREVEVFLGEMNRVKADYQFIVYSDAVHAFTQKSAGDDSSKGAAYNETADRRSWLALMDFLDEVIPVSK